MASIEVMVKATSMFCELNITDLMSGGSPCRRKCRGHSWKIKGSTDHRISFQAKAKVCMMASGLSHPLAGSCKSVSEPITDVHGHLEKCLPECVQIVCCKTFPSYLFSHRLQICPKTAASAVISAKKPCRILGIDLQVGR